jgi:catalase
MGGPAPDSTAAEPPIDLDGQAARHPQEVTDDDFFQPGELYRRVMNDTDREHLVGNILAHLGNAKKRIQLRQTALFFKADPDYARRVAQGLGLDVRQVERLAAMSQEGRVKATAK